MIYAFLLLWIMSALFIIAVKKTVRMIIYLGVFSLTSSICFFMLSAPDVAMADIAVGAFEIIFFIVCLERYYDLGVDASDTAAPEHKKVKPAEFIKNGILPVCFIAFLFILFIMFAPSNPADNHLKDLYLSLFQRDIGGENAVTAIYLGYRVYDTLFETLMLLVAVVAVAHLSHLSWHQHTPESANAGVESGIAMIIIRVISPLLLLFGLYLIANGHLSPGGGFQGGVVIAAFFICRYLVHDISDMRMERYVTLEKLVFFAIVIVTVVFIFTGSGLAKSVPHDIYLILINSLIGLKVAWGFIIILYRYIAFERR